MKLTKDAYVRLVDEDIAWLEANTGDTLEQDHIIQVLKWSVGELYPEPGSGVRSEGIPGRLW